MAGIIFKKIGPVLIGNAPNQCTGYGKNWNEVGTLPPKTATNAGGRVAPTNLWSQFAHRRFVLQKRFHQKCDLTEGYS